MIINRNNYEEYFLLYNDNELTEKERLMVEEFVQLNADLRVEFELMKELKLDPADEIRFDKSSLYKPITLQDNILQPTADQEKLLLFIDNEMNEEDKVKLESELKVNPILRKEFELLNKLKMTSDLSIVHPDKASLYKKEEQPASIIRITWIRVAVAAVFVLMMGLLFMNKTSEPTAVVPIIAEVSEPELKSVDQQNAKKVESIVIGDKNDADGTTNQKTENAGVKLSDATVNDQAGKGHNNTVQSQKGIKTEMVKRLPSVSNKTNNQITQGVAVVKQPAFNSKIGSETKQGISTEEIATTTLNTPTLKEIVDMPSSSIVKSDYATEALLNDNATEEQEMLVQDNSPRKGAFRGLLRKANRFVNKVTNPDSNGPSVKVASFEIALAK